MSNKQEKPTDFWTPYDNGELCEVEGCWATACSFCEMCDAWTCPEHTVKLGEEESYCPECNPRVQ